MEEKREHKRKAAKIKSEVHSGEGLTFSNSIDMSKGGLFISTPEPLSVGSEISLSLQIPGEDPVDIKGVVKWVREEEDEDYKAGMGIEFIGASGKTLDQLKKIVE